MTTAPTLDLPTFVATWQVAAQSERSSAHSHFLDLCRLLGQPPPLTADPTGDWFAFEKGVAKSGGGQGFADVWRRGHFAWEYKGRHKDLTAAYQQLNQYREALENPPLLVVCDLDRVEVHTNFTDTEKAVYTFDLAALDANQPTATTHGRPPLEVLRTLFTAPDSLKPRRTTEDATRQAAADFALVSDGLRTLGIAPDQSARFLMRLLFCLFAEDIGLLPTGVFTRLVQHTQRDITAFRRQLAVLFATMRTGGWFGTDHIAYFNGGLFDDDDVLNISSNELAILRGAAGKNWASIEPAVFGTLFERSLDPAKRSQLGAHYTSKADIQLIVEPVLMAPLRRRWATVRAEVAALLDQAHADPAEGERAQTEAGDRLRAFLAELAAVQVLDPACGSGNFLYVALKLLLDLEKEVITFCVAEVGLRGLTPRVSPAQLHGIETDPYAHELAGVVIWIGYLQWMHDNGFSVPGDPILKPLQAIQRMDAILTHDDAGRPTEPAWPAVDVIIGNPPFLGDKKMRAELGDEYVEALRQLYAGRVPGGADLVCYWFEKARAQIEAGQAKRAGLLATQSIRRGSSRQVLDRSKQSGDIFTAWSDRPWVLDGAAVRVSLIGVDAGLELERTLDGRSVSSINADLTSTRDLTEVNRLRENAGLSFQGIVKVGPLDIPSETAKDMLTVLGNPHGHPNSDVIKPWINALDITHGKRHMWVIDFDQRTLEDAALYEAPFEYVRLHVKPLREQNRDQQRRQFW